MEKVHAIPNAELQFSFASRKMINPMEKAVSQRAETREIWDLWESWVLQALQALGSLHAAGLVHGAIHPTALRVDETLRIGNLQHVRPKNAAIPIDTFHANTLFTPPEILLYWGRHQGVSFANMYHSLKQENWPMDQIETYFPDIQHTQSVLQKVYDGLDQDWAEASDVWMLGYSLLSVYTEMLQNPFAITSAFYRDRHGDFLDLVEKMVQPNPSQRASIAALVSQWENTITSSQGETSALSVPSETSVSETSASANPSESVASVKIAAPLRPVRRLFLNGPIRPAGRNKTRRNAGN